MYKILAGKVDGLRTHLRDEKAGGSPGVTAIGSKTHCTLPLSRRRYSDNDQLENATGRLELRIHRTKTVSPMVRTAADAGSTIESLISKGGGIGVGDGSAGTMIGATEVEGEGDARADGDAESEGRSGVTGVPPPPPPPPGLAGVATILNASPSVKTELSSSQTILIR